MGNKCVLAGKDDNYTVIDMGALGSVGLVYDFSRERFFSKKPDIVVLKTDEGLVEESPLQRLIEDCVTGERSYDGRFGKDRVKVFSSMDLYFGFLDFYDSIKREGVPSETLATEPIKDILEMCGVAQWYRDGDNRVHQKFYPTGIKVETVIPGPVGDEYPEQRAYDELEFGDLPVN